MAERLGGVAESGIVEGGLSTWVLGGWNVERLEGSQLLRIKGTR